VSDGNAARNGVDASTAGILHVDGGNNPSYHQQSAVDTPITGPSTSIYANYGAVPSSSSPSSSPVAPAQQHLSAMTGDIQDVGAGTSNPNWTPSSHTLTPQLLQEFNIYHPQLVSQNSASSSSHFEQLQQQPQQAPQAPQPNLNNAAAQEDSEDPSQHKLYCTRCSDPYNVIVTPIPHYKVLLQDTFLLSAISLMTLCILVLSFCCILLLVQHWGTNDLIVDFGGGWGIKVTWFAGAMLMFCYALYGATWLMVWDHTSGHVEKHVVGVEVPEEELDEGHNEGEDVERGGVHGHVSGDGRIVVDVVG
jgi:hypothetical protein